jgi:hypothetical protein
MKRHVLLDDLLRPTHYFSCACGALKCSMCNGWHVSLQRDREMHRTHGQSGLKDAGIN